MVKLLVMPSDFDLLHVHLDDLAEVNQQLIHNSQHHLTLASQVDLLDRTIIVRRPFIEFTLEELYETVLAPGKQRLRMDGRLLESWEIAWIIHQLRLAVDRLHDAGLFHGALHPANVLIDSALTVFLADLSPYKPYGLPVDDPSLRMLFYKDSQTVFIDPARFGAGHGDTKQRQKADLFALEAIVSSIQLDELSSVTFQPSVDSIVVPLVRQLGEAFDISELESRIEDLCLLAADDQEITAILSRLMVSRLNSLETEFDVLRLLRCIKRVLSGAKSSDCEFYLKALADLKISRAITSACNGEYPVMEAETKDIWTEEQISRHLRSNEPSKEELNLLIALLLHPSGNLRHLALDRLHAVLQSMDEADRVALVRTQLRPVLQVEGPFDIGRLDREALPFILKRPLNEGLFALILRNQERIPQFLQAFSAEEAGKLEALGPLLDLLGAKQELEVLNRKVMGVNPRSWPQPDDPEAFSPLLSPVDEDDTNSLPIVVEPSVYRHFQQRRHPFAFDQHGEIGSSPSGAYFAARCQDKITVWRSQDFRSLSIPEPWMTLPCQKKASFCLSDNELIICMEDMLTCHELHRRQLVCETAFDSLARMPVHMVPFQHLILVVFPGSLALFDCTKQEFSWKSRCCDAFKGPITQAVVSSDGMYAVTCSMHGYLSLWDLRFGLCLRSWCLPAGLVCGLALLPTEHPSLSPPSLWVLVEQDDAPVLFIVQLSSASIVASTLPEYIDEPLLDDQQREHGTRQGLAHCAFVHPPGANWVLFTGPNGDLFTCSARQGELDAAPIRPGFKVSPVRALHALLPTSMESSRNLSLLHLATGGALTILELLK